MDLTLPQQADADSTAAIESDHSTHDGGGRRARMVDGGIAGGVAVYIGRQLGIDPLWIRIAFVLLALAGGVGIVLYAGLWLALVIGPTMGWRMVTWIGGMLVVAGIPAVLVAGNVRAITGWFAVVILLAGLALALWQPRRQLTALPVSRSSTESVAEGPAWPETPPHVPVAVTPRPPRPRREPSILGRAALGLAIVVAAVGALVDDANGGRMHPEQWLGAAALVCGIGVLIGTSIGRARWLMLPAIAFAGTGFAAGEMAGMGIDLGDATGDRWISASNGAPTVQRAETGIGDVYVQLDQFTEPLDDEYVVDARAAIGTVYVSVGSLDVEVEVRGRTDHGRTLLDGQHVDDDLTVNPNTTGDGRLVVNAWVGVGDIIVYQSFASDLTVATTTPYLPLAPEEGGSIGDGTLVQIDQYLAGTTDGWIVLLNGEAVIDPDDQVVSGQTYTNETSQGGDVESVAIETSIGEFRLLPRSLLLTPDGRVLDLRSIRESLAVTPPTSTPPSITAALPPSDVSTEPNPVVTVAPTNRPPLITAPPITGEQP